MTPAPFTFFKEHEEGVKKMYSAFQEVRDEGRQEGRQEGRDEATRTFVKAILSKGKSMEETADLLHLALDEVKKIVEQRESERAIL